jgi:hypothetical protein
MKRDGAAVAREAHNLQVVGSNPAPATRLRAVRSGISCGIGAKHPGCPPCLYIATLRP